MQINIISDNIVAQGDKKERSMIKYRLYNSEIFLFEGFCSESEFILIKEKYNFGKYKIEIMK